MENSELVCFDCGSKKCTFEEGTFECLHCNLVKSWEQMITLMGYPVTHKLHDLFHKTKVNGISVEIEYTIPINSKDKPYFLIRSPRPTQLKDLIGKIQRCLGVSVQVTQTGIDYGVSGCPICGGEIVELGENSISLGCARFNKHFRMVMFEYFFIAAIKESIPSLYVSTDGSGIYLSFTKTIKVTKKRIFEKQVYEEILSRFFLEFRAPNEGVKDLVIAVPNTLSKYPETKGVLAVLKKSSFPGIRVIPVGIY